MPEKPSEQEPSIEEILASIRQIIADDDEEPAQEAAVEATPEPAPVAAPAPKAEPKPEPKPEVIELTEVIRDEEPQDDIIVELQEHEEELPPPPPPTPKPAARPAPVAEEDDISSILTDNAAHAALQGFARLASRTPVERQSHLAGITLEDIVRDLMRPMLRDWLDQNLPPLIEKMVAKELQRLARKAELDE